MERLTYKVHDGGVFVKKSDVKTFDVEDEIMHTGNAIRKLAEYEDLEEQTGIKIKDLYRELFSYIANRDNINPDDTCFTLLTKEESEEYNRYKKDKKQGLLLKRPCKVGDTVYTNTSMQGWYFRKENRPYEARIVFIGINGADNYMNVDFGNGRMLQFKFSEIGKTVFLTQAEAEEALRRMEREE